MEESNNNVNVQESDNNLENNTIVKEPEKKPNKNNKLIIISIICMILCFIAGYALSKFMMGDTKEKDKQEEQKEEKKEENKEEQKEEQKEEPKEQPIKDEIGLDEKTKNQLLNIAQLNMKENKCVESSDSDYFYRLIDVNGVLNSLDIDDKMMIIYIYASRNDLLTAIRGENDSRCSTDGAGLCNVLTYENFKKILKVYGFDDIDLSKLDLGYEVSVIDNDLVFSYGGSTCDSYLKNDVVFSKVDDNIVLTDKMEFFHNETGDLIKTVTRDYIFKTYEENGEVNYYLYSVETK